MKSKSKLSLGSISCAGRPSEVQKEQLLVELERHLLFEKRYSKYNVNVIMQRIRRLVYHYQVSSTPTQDDAMRVEELLKANDAKGNTIRHYLRAMELMSEYQGIPLKLAKPKQVFRMPDILSLAECRALANACLNNRDRAIISVLLYTGVRNKELINLDLEDIDLKNRILWVRDRGADIKNRHERKAVISADCAQDLKSWLMARPQVETKSLFITQYGKRLSKERLDRLVDEAGRRAGIEKKVYPHLLRHTCASMMLRSGIPLTDVALQLGHRSLSSTMVYLHSDVESLKENVDKKFKY